MVSNKVVYERQSKEELKGLYADPITGNIWIYSEKELYVIHVKDEDKDIWKLFLQFGKEGKPQYFEKALQLCKTEEAREEVYRAQGNYYFSEKNYRMAAEFFAKTSVSLEEVSLLFMEKGRRSDLRTYLLYKLNDLPYQKKAQRTLLCTWLTEIYLDEIINMGVSYCF